MLQGYVSAHASKHAIANQLLLPTRYHLLLHFQRHFPL